MGYKIAFYSLLVFVVVGGVGYLAFHQHYADRNQFERLYYLERNQSIIAQHLQQLEGQGQGQGQGANAGTGPRK